jgi:hypothetical protein
MERITKKKFQEMLNAMDAGSAKPISYRNNQYHQKTRLYGDYLRAQDPEMFNANYAEYLHNGQHQHLAQYE